MKQKDKLAVKFLITDFAKARKADSPSIGIICDQLLKMLVPFGMAWSDMAIRNLLSDMVRLLSKLELDKTLTGPAKLRSLDVKKAINGYLGGHSPSRSRYESVVCLGYKFQCSDNRYAGMKDDPEDMLTRCNNLKVAIRSAYGVAGRMDGGAGNTNPKMLKIFMAPEFFFRGKNGAYSHEVVHGREAQPDAKPLALTKVKGIMEVMRDEIDQDIYKDWLFVLGTAIAAAELTESQCQTCGAVGKIKFERDLVKGGGATKAVCVKDPSHVIKEVSLGAIVENVAFVKKEGCIHTISKELVSHIDYRGGKVKVGGTEMGVHKSPQPSGYDSATKVPTKFKDERMGGSIFTVDGVTIGLEVCLDHAATRDSSASGRLEHAANIQIQLIPSAGMEIEALRTVPGGIVFNVDGVTPHVAVVAGAMQAQQVIETTEGKRSFFEDNTGLYFAKPCIGHAGSGAVIGYGPYEIPGV